MDSFCSKPIAPKSLREELITSKALEVSKQVDAHFVISQAEEKKDILAFDSMVKETNRKAEEGSLSSYSQLDNPSCPVCLIATGSTSVGKTLMRAVEALGWRGSLVQNGEDALRLLKMRNWDAVFLDDEMPMLAGMRCISCFREWEKNYRVARQNKVYLISGNLSQGAKAMSPPGFDGVIGKPVKLIELKNALESLALNGTHLLIR
jgi:CheY-like chemotaxis protein